MRVCICEVLSGSVVQGRTDHRAGHVIATRLEGLRRSVSCRILQSTYWLETMSYKGWLPVTVLCAVPQSAQLLGTANR